MTEAFTVGHATLKAASSKVAKYEKTCSNNQYAIDTFSFLASRGGSRHLVNVGLKF